MSMDGTYGKTDPQSHGFRLATFVGVDGVERVIAHAQRQESIDLALERATAFHRAKVRNRVAREAARPLGAALAVELYGEARLAAMEPDDAQSVRTEAVHAVAEAITRSDDAFRATHALVSMTHTEGSMELLRIVESLMSDVALRASDPTVAIEEAEAIERMLLARSGLVRAVVSEWRDPGPMALSA